MDAALFGIPSETIRAYAKPGSTSPAIENTNGRLVALADGLPVKAADGTVIGAIGVSDGKRSHFSKRDRSPASGQHQWLN